MLLSACFKKGVIKVNAIKYAKMIFFRGQERGIEN